jgi:hypothetical protein
VHDADIGRVDGFQPPGDTHRAGDVINVDPGREIRTTTGVLKR